MDGLRVGDEECDDCNNQAPQPRMSRLGQAHSLPSHLQHARAVGVRRTRDPQPFHPPMCSEAYFNFVSWRCRRCTWILPHVVCLSPWLLLRWSAGCLTGRLTSLQTFMAQRDHVYSRRVARSVTRIDVGPRAASLGVWGFDVAAGSLGLRWQRRALGGSTARA